MAAEAFHRVLAIDFSAASSPTRGANSLWLAVAEGDEPIRTQNLKTRADLARLLSRIVARPGRSLVVFDVALGWPQGTAREIGLRGTPVTAMYRLLDDMIRDAADNANNRFEVASELNRRAGSALFWGHPPTQTYAHLLPTKAVPAGLVARRVSERRRIERHVGGVIKSPFQLSGAGAVGSQSIMAQVMISRLRRAGVAIAVWPFEPPTARVVVGEYFFSLAAVASERGSCLDQRQVRAVARFLRSEVRAGRSPVREELLDALSPEDHRAVRREEGWLVAVPA